MKGSGANHHPRAPAPQRSSWLCWREFQSRSCSAFPRITGWICIFISPSHLISVYLILHTQHILFFKCWASIADVVQPLTRHWINASQRARYIHPMLFQCWANVEDKGLNCKQQYAPTFQVSSYWKDNKTATSYCSFPLHGYTSVTTAEMWC